MSTERRCENCTAWVLWKGFMGHCKALPPISTAALPNPSTSVHSGAVWPMTRDGDWCRDGFTAKE